uniref:Secreted protein n=1 Tax=Strongyloides stercoralis TaxID=6248 RepID=A0A0K0EF67_STRER
MIVIKVLLFLFYLFISATSSNVAVYEAKVGDTLEFDFGRAIKQLQVVRNLGNGIEKLSPSYDLNELINKSIKNQYNTNAILSKEGLLIINPVTEDDFGTYTSDVNYHPHFSNPVLKVVPMT